jgi:glutamate dehydrogenase/leucine dehydrogenase/CBS domain-containing protein
MIPKSMELFLIERLPERTWRNRVVREDGRCYMEFSAIDVERLSRLGITVDQLGPKLLACIWDEDSSEEVGGYLVVDNLAMGRPAMGGIRISPNLTPAEVFYRARGMTLKNAAAFLPYGGGKVGLVADPHLDEVRRQEVLQRVAHLLVRYNDLFLPGPDVGTHTQDMKIIASQNGLDLALSKPEEMGGNRLDEIGAAGGGLVIALEALLKELPRLRSLPQFTNLVLPEPDVLTVLLQGFGAVGANAARILVERMPSARVIGVSDTSGYIYDSWGLPVTELHQLWLEHRSVSNNYFSRHITPKPRSGPKYCTNGDDLLRESAFCLIPAAPVSNYLDTDPASHPSITVDRMGKWSMIIEGANTYSPDPAGRSTRQRMEREVYRRRGVLIAPDFLVNSGAVIYAAQEQIIRTPPHLQLPEIALGDNKAVDKWLRDHSTEFQELSAKRREAAEKARDEVIRRNMVELVDQLITDPDILPCEAAETISIQRISSSERTHTAADIMESAISVSASCTIQDAATLLIETGTSLLTVLDPFDLIVGVVTQWDITRATANGLEASREISEIMTRQVISAAPSDSLVEVVRKLEYHEISVIPVVQDSKVLGIVSTDLLARRSLLPLLVKQDH